MGEYWATIMDKIFETNFRLHAKQLTTGKVKYLFLVVFYQSRKNFPFGRKTGHQTAISLSFKIFLNFPKDPVSYVVRESMRLIITPRFACEKKIGKVSKTQETFLLHLIYLKKNSLKKQLLHYFKPTSLYFNNKTFFSKTMSFFR